MTQNMRNEARPPISRKQNEPRFEESTKALTTYLLVLGTFFFALTLKYPTIMATHDCTDNKNESCCQRQCIRSGIDNDDDDNEERVAFRNTHGPVP